MPLCCLSRRDALHLLGGAALALTSCRGARPRKIVVGSKNFTEQIILGELLSQQIETHTNLQVDRRLNLGGTFICHQAMLSGQMDLYPEYTGTALTAILKQPPATDAAGVYASVRDAYRNQFHLEVGPPLGFNNTFAMIIRGEDAARLNVHTISEMVPYAAKWRAGFGYEFME